MSEDLFNTDQAPEGVEPSEAGEQTSDNHAPVVPPGASIDEVAEAAGIAATGTPAPKKPRRPRGEKQNFPRRTLEDALKIPQVIQEFNGGNPWPPGDVAKAIGSTAASTTYFYWAAAAREYGLTEGGRDAAVISITDLGRRAVAPTSGDERAQALVEAFLNIEVFRAVVEHFKGSKLPPEEYLVNNLVQNFGVAREHVSEFIETFESNARFVGIGNTWDGTVAVVAPAVVAPATTNSASLPTPAAATASTDARPRCFVAMPFTVHNEGEYPPGYFKEVMNELLYPAIREAGFEPSTALQTGSDVIHATIVNDLLDADMVIVDLTEHNPNVLFELGLRMMEKKPVAIVRAKGTRPIFDVTNMIRMYDYDGNLWTSTVKEDIPKIAAHIKATWDGRQNSPYIELLRKR